MKFLLGLDAADETGPAPRLIVPVGDMTGDRVGGLVGGTDGLRVGVSVGNDGKGAILGVTVSLGCAAA